MNCVFRNNTAETMTGGGIAACGTSIDTIRLVNCTMLENGAPGQFGEGGGVRSWGQVLDIDNCIFWDNGDALNGSGALGQVSHVAPPGAGLASVDHSVVMNGPGPYAGAGVITADPLFTTDCTGLTASSPCIDAGENASVPPESDADLEFCIQGQLILNDNGDRITDGDGNGSIIVDIGADEYPGNTTLAGDTDGDGDVDVDDLTHVILDWGTDGSANGGDVVGQFPGDPPDGTVDVNDLVAVVNGWT